MFDKKGQSALEYLMTYGWALVVIVVVIGVLAFLGVFNLGGTIEACTGFPAKFTYASHNYTSAGVFTLAFTSGLATDVKVTKLKVGATEKTLAAPVTFNSGKVTTVSDVGFPTGTSGQSYNSDVVVTYDELKADGTTLIAGKTANVKCTAKFQ